MNTLVWFRSDLRTRDNTALHAAACANHGCLIGVFILCPQQWKDHHWGGPRVDFLLRNLRALGAELKRLNIPLKIVRSNRFDGVPQALLKLARAHDCAALYCNSEHEVNEVRRDDEVRAAFETDNRQMHTFRDQTILDVADIRTQAGGWYSVFTPFKRKWCELFKSGDELKEFAPPQPQSSSKVPADEVPTQLAGFSTDADRKLWPEGESSAHQRLASFVDQAIADYATRRDEPATDGTSALSPYLACGVLSPRQCLRAALAVNHNRVDSGKKGVATWISELIWREFYRHILIGFPRVCMDRPFRTETERLRWNNDTVQFEAWCAGATGFPIVDAGMRQLAAAGWMHNRVRMIVAMFLTKDLFIDWRWGERFFMEHLVDGDFASNNGGWQWSASTGTDAAPYFRVFNPARQSERYDPNGAYIRRWVPELEPVPANRIHDPDAATRGERDYPAPIVDRSKSRARVVEAFKRLGGSR
ncbi:MAG: deoxyribodipyrimidine photo-lyase [Phycisphaerales bacterium]|nr:deoxyribodipyrimidine photo-lyase [Phycisphaerales bacterium]